MDGKNKVRSITASNEGGPALSLAHEINNPLESLVNLTYLLESEVTSEKGREYLRLVFEEVHRLSAIAHAALAEYRNSALQETNIPKLLMSVLLLYKSKLDLLGINVVTHFCGTGDLAIYPVLLRQAFTNLLLNAAEAMPKGGTIHVRVALAQEWCGQERRGLYITIADNGCGIAKADLAKILLGQSFTTKGDSGNGVGLSIVHDTVRKHAGVFRSRSSTSPGRSGTVFRIFLPSTSQAHAREFPLPRQR